MKTLRELDIAPSFDLLERLGNAKKPYETALDLSQKAAVIEECAWRLGDPSWFQWFESIVNRYGGKVTFED